MGGITDMGYIYQWQIDGKRRPFPSISNAAKAYGMRVFFNKPQYAADDICPWCGKPVANKRRVYCSDNCKQAFDNITVWHRGRDPYSLRILYRDNFTCQDCGGFHAHINDYGMCVPIDDGQMEVHHILPVAAGGGDEPENLVSLCKKCHKKRHDVLKEMEGKE